MERVSKSDKILLEYLLNKMFRRLHKQNGKQLFYGIIKALQDKGFKTVLNAETNRLYIKEF